MSLTEEEFVEVYNKNYKSLLSYVNNYTKNIGISEEVVSEAFRRLYMNKSKVPESACRSWLFVVCRNTAFKRIKKDSKFVFQASCGTEDLCSAPTPIESIILNENYKDSIDALADVLSKLPSRTQRIVKAKYYEQLSYNEIAKKEKISVGNVGFILNNALSKIRVQYTRNRQQSEKL
jgi:RNA polymerase sigma-70 factor (ECF subfamily)